MSSSMKKRRVVGGDSAAADDNGIDSGSGGASVSEDLKDIKSTMSEMMSMVKGMHDEMKDMRKDMNGMQKEITKLTKKCGGMEKLDKKFDGIEETLDDMRKRQKYIRVLLKNQKWEYSVDRPSEEYWDNLDDDEGEDDAAESFLSDIQNSTEKMRYGSDGDIQISAPLLYNEELLPHWEEFSNAIEQYQYHQKCSHRGRKTFSLMGVELSDPILGLLSQSLQSTYFEQFALGLNLNFGEEGIKFALDYLENNDSCKRFSLHNNPMNNMEDIQRLGNIVKEHPTIKELILHGCIGEGMNGYEMLKTIMISGRNKLKMISLDDNSISTGGDTFISDFLANNKKLKTLSMTENQLDDNDALLIAGAVKHNTTLSVIYLTDNNLTSTGWEALSRSLFDKTSLNTAADSNHTCSIEGFSPIEEGITPLGQENVNAEEYLCCPVCLRKKKVYSILSARNRSLSNVDHFNDDMPVELLPHMLNTIERYANYHETNEDDDAPPQDTRDVKPLSIVFEILQRWDKSLAIFEALSCS